MWRNYIGGTPLNKVCYCILIHRPATVLFHKNFIFESLNFTPQSSVRCKLIESCGIIEYHEEKPGVLCL